MVHTRKPGVYRDMKARRAYRRAWMAAARARASTKSGEAAARKKEPVAAHERETEIKPNGVPDDRRRKLMAGKRDRDPPSYPANRDALPLP
jgi:hypothetical protein